MGQTIDAKVTVIDGQVKQAQALPLQVYVAGENVPERRPPMAPPAAQGEKALAIYREQDMGTIEALAQDAASALREWGNYCESARRRGETVDAGLVRTFVDRVVDQRKAIDGISAWTFQDAESRPSPQTVKEYRRDTQDLLLWLATREISPADCAMEDLKNYRAFLQSQGAPEKMEEVRAEWYGRAPRTTAPADGRDWVMVAALNMLGSRGAESKRLGSKWILMLSTSYRLQARSERQTAYSKGTVGLKLTVTRVFFKMALARQAVFLNPALDISGPKDKTQRRDRIRSRYFSDQEVRLLLSTCDPNHPKDIRDKTLMALACVQGLRISELSGLDLEDFNPSIGKSGALQIRHAKGDKSRVVDLSPKMRQLLDRWLAVRAMMKPSTPALFVTMNINHRPDTTPPGERIAERGIRNMFDERQRLVGIKRPGRSMHGLRHSYATNVVRKKGSLPRLSYSMGHSSIVTTQVYVDVVELEDDNPAELADDVL